MNKSLMLLIRRGALPVLASAAALTAVAGCGAASSSASQEVASIPSSSSPAHAPASAAGTATASSAARPVERLDDTPAQRDALIQAWNDCLVAHGATYGNVPGVAGSKNLANIPASATAACMNKEPQLPPQLDPATNPQYRADSIANVACLRAHGLMVHLVADTSVFANGLSWTFDSSGGPPLPANAGQIEDECQLKAFGGKN